MCCTDMVAGTPIDQLPGEMYAQTAGRLCVTTLTRGADAQQSHINTDYRERLYKFATGFVLPRRASNSKTR